MPAFKVTLTPFEGPPHSQIVSGCATAVKAFSAVLDDFYLSHGPGRLKQITVRESKRAPTMAATSPNPRGSGRRLC